MTQDEIIRMAREAGIEADENNGYLEWWNFAKLVAAHERASYRCDEMEEQIESLMQDLSHAVLAEREACASLRDKFFNETDDEESDWNQAIDRYAAAIRARGEK